MFKRIKWKSTISVMSDHHINGEKLIEVSRFKWNVIGDPSCWDNLINQHQMIYLWNLCRLWFFFFIVCFWLLCWLKFFSVLNCWHSYLNMVAFRKILKKFDKVIRLHAPIAATTIPSYNSTFQAYTPQGCRSGDLLSTLRVLYIFS